MQVVRIVLACLGAAVVVATSVSVLTALVIPRGRLGRLQRRTDQAVAAVFRLLARPLPDYPSRDRLLAAQGPAFLAVVLVSWLAGYLLGFALLLWPFSRSLSGAFRESGSSLLTLGFASTPSAGPTLLDFLCAAAGLVAVALQIGYLPTLYSAFSRRETEVTLLASRAGSPPWGPELLARTRVGLQAESEMADFYRGWERWAADVAESHSNYPALIRFRSPQANASWIVGMLAVLDSAALYLAVAPTRAPIAGRLVLRMGFTALRQIADAIGLPYDPDPRPDAPLQLTEAEFGDALRRLDDVGFPRERDDAEAWSHFRGWRVNYESIAYALCREVDAVPALWSGSRRSGEPPLAPIRPPVRTPQDPDGSSGRGGLSKDARPGARKGPPPWTGGGPEPRG
ncbi:MAG TPA: hypothetical protein VGN54_04355 [Mycobacteriales bacterium]|nr:hypothetical protein [Mycobacteriales bacterium]